jgi:transposase
MQANTLIQQIKDVEEARDALLVAADEPTPALLLSLKGIGPEFAAVLWSEGLSRKFDNRRQVAAYAGLVPMACCRFFGHEVKLT